MTYVLSDIHGNLRRFESIMAQINLQPDDTLMYLFTPIPLSSIALGFVLKSKGYKYTKNIVAGVIMTAILCIYGSFAFTF